MAEERLLIVNADDFGYSAAVNAGIVEAHAKGVVTSTSLMVRRPAAPEAADLAAGRPSLAVGLHIDIGQWDYVSGEWKLAYQHCPPDDAEAAERECRDQLRAFEELIGRPPTHIDSHQHTHMREPIASVTAKLAADLNVPLRGRTIRYEGGFYGQTGKGEPYPEGITVARLGALIESLPPGWTELGCHPGLGVEAESSYGPEREVELRSLCDPRIRAAIRRQGVELRSFADRLERPCYSRPPCD